MKPFVFILGWVSGEGFDMYSLSIYNFNMSLHHKENTTPSFTIACSVITNKRKSEHNSILAVNLQVSSCSFANVAVVPVVSV